MALKLLETLPMQGLLMCVEDEQGQKQVFLRVWKPNESGTMWLQANPMGDNFVKLSAAEVERMDEAVLPLLHAYTVDQLRADGQTAEAEELEKDYAEYR